MTHKFTKGSQVSEIFVQQWLIQAKSPLHLLASGSFQIKELFLPESGAHTHTHTNTTQHTHLFKIRFRKTSYKLSYGPKNQSQHLSETK